MGAGDAMVAGVFHGVLGGDFARGLRYGAVCAALSLGQIGDLPSVDADELTKGVTKAMGDRALRETAAARSGVGIVRPPNALGTNPRSQSVEVLSRCVRAGAVGACQPLDKIVVTF